MPAVHRSPRLLALLAAVALATGGAPGAGADDDAWALVGAARDALTGGRWRLEFTQTFVPAGFSSGETERGRAALDLPRGLRWDYDTPFPRTYLVVDDTVYTWNEGEPSGRRFPLGAEEARHLELLRLDVERLRERYAARLVPAPDATGSAGGVAVVELQPLEDDARIVEASLSVDRDSRRLVAIGYRDAEGNATRFELSSLEASDEPGLFAPPEDLEWIDS